MDSKATRRRTSWLLVVMSAAAVTAPVAQAKHAPATGANALVQSAAVWTASDREVDRLGPKYVPLQHPFSLQPATVVKVVRPGGFDWTDAGIGAGVTGLALALSAALGLLVSRRSETTASAPATGS
jgi:hypothetical protein